MNLLDKIAQNFGFYAMLAFGIVTVVCVCWEIIESFFVGDNHG